VPFTAWGAYLASLIAAQGGPVSSVEDGLSVFIHAIPYNFYPMLIIGFALLVALRVIPDFGPMRRAERRVQETGALIRPGANPLVDDSVDASLEAAAVAHRIAPIREPEELMQQAAETVRARMNHTYVAVVVLDDEGALDFQSEMPFAFALDDVAAGETLAEFLVIALQNARLFQEARRRNEGSDNANE
jgi:hypothetical protein